MGGGLDIGRALKGAIARPFPIRDGWFDKSGFGVVMGQEIRLAFRPFRKVFLQDLRDVAMKLPSLAFQQAFVSRFLHQSVLEDVTRLWRRAAAEDQLGVRQLG